MGSYTNKSAENLKNLVQKEFKRIDKRGYRDDQEIYNAGWNICITLKNQIKSDKTMNYGPWALKPLDDLINQLKNARNKMRGINFTTNNADIINQIANRIDNAENETLARLRKNNTTQESRNVVSRATQKSNQNPMFTMEGGTDYRKQTGNIVFTKAANPVKIHKACAGLFTEKINTYTIDYTNCTNPSIKSRMHQAIGSYTCFLYKDPNLNTYTLRDKNGNELQIRARIREGVKLIPEGVRKRNAHVQKQKEQESAGRVESSQISKLTQEMLKDMPSLKNYDAIYQNELCKATEQRILTLLKKAKRLGYELDPECVTKLHFSSGIMELHLNSGSSETSRTFWNSSDEINAIIKKPTISKTLYKFLDDNESQYKTRLTKRIKAKWNELGGLTKTETINVGANNNPKDKIDIKQKNQILYGIENFEKMIENYRDSTGDSWLSNDDRRLVRIKQILADAKNSINNSNSLGKDAIIKNIINPIRNEWRIIKNINKMQIQGGGNMGGRAVENQFYKQNYDYLTKVFLGNKSEQLKAMRELGWYGRLLDNTETSFIAEEIEGDEELDIKIKDGNVQKCVENIKKRCSMSADNPKVRNRYDNTFASARRGTDSLITLFVGRGWLPQNWKNEKSEVRKYVDNLREQLISIDNQTNNFQASVESMKKNTHTERLRLEMKDNKTEEELKTLQSLIYLDENSDKANELYKETIEETKKELRYGSLGQVIRGGLMPALGELGGGYTGKDAKIANDIRGYGFRNLSDENAKVAGEIITEIVITVVVAVCTAGVGAVAVAGALRCASLVARGAKWMNLAKKIEKVVRISKAGARGWKTANLAGKTAQATLKGTGLLIEGTAFNAASNVIHSGINGTSLDNLNLNPVAKENVQTAAFLGALSIAGKFTQGIMRVGGKTKLSVNPQKGRKVAGQKFKEFSKGIGAEMGAMLLAEQAVNFTFGHDVIDPETGEVVTSRTPKLPTQQELTQMVGMILAFKAVKPGLWHKYEQKLNNGTLEICRGVRKNEVLIRDPKTGSVERIQDLIDGKGTKPSTKQNSGSTREGITRKKGIHERRRSELEMERSNLETRRQELLRKREANWRSLDGQENGIGKLTDILKKGNIITIDGLKYQFTGIKNGKAEFIINPAAKKSAQQSGRAFSERVEVSSLEELLDSRFNLEPGQKRTNSGRYDKLNQLINEKIEPLNRLQNKIKNKKSEISTLEEEIARLEKGRNTVAKNDYFEQHKNEIVGRNVRIDGVKYRAEHVNGDGTIQFKEVDGNRNFTISSFKQLAGKGQVNGFSDGIGQRGSESLTQSERNNHETIRNLISGESEYLSSRNINQTIRQKRANLQTAQQELRGLEDQLPASQSRQQAINERARKGAEINKELRQVESRLERIGRDLPESERLTKKYQDAIDQLEGDGVTRGEETASRQQERAERTAEFLPKEQTSQREPLTEESLRDKFDKEVSNEGIVVNGDRYKLEYRENMTQNPNKKGEYVWMKNGKVIRSVKAETKTLPDNADGNRIRSEYNRLRNEYVRSKNSNTTTPETQRRKVIENNTERNSKLIESRLNSDLNGMINNHRKLKLDWVTKAQFESGVFIEGVHRRFKNLSLKPNTKLPKEFLRKMRKSLKEFKTKCRNNLSEKYKKLVDRYNEFFVKKLREEGNEIEIKKEEIDIIEKSSKTFGEYNQEFADIIRNNQNKIINLEKIENMDSFINESFKFLKEEMGIDDPNLKIKILEGTEGIDNHYDRSTNTVYFSRNFGGERQIYLKGGNKAETFGGIGHELNHYLQEVEIIKHYLKDNETINTFVEGIMNESDKEWINRYINQIDFNEPISERAIKYAKYYTEAGKDKTIFDKNGKILDHNKYRNLGYEKESFDRGDILADEYRKTTKSYKEQQRREREEQQRREREILSKTVKSESLRNVHFKKILDKSRTFELPLKDHVCEYIRIVKEGEYPDRQKYSYKNGKLTEDPNGCYIKLNEGDITPEEGRECFLRGLKISSELMNGQKNRAVLSSGSLFLNIESYGKLGGDIDIATDVTAFNNVALQRGSDGLTTLERFQRDGKIRDLIFTKIDHSVIDIKNMSEHEITELIEKGDIRVEFNIPDAKGNTINCEFFPEPEGYGLIQLGTPRADGGLLSYEIEGNLIKTVSPELAAMSYMINLAHEFKNNSLDAWNKTKEKAKDKGKRNIPKLKDSVRMNNFFQYLESANIRTVSDMIKYIDRTIANYEQQHGKKIEIEVTEGDKKVKKTIDMSAYLRKGLDKLPDVKKLLQDVEIDYQKTLGNSRIKALRGTETKLSFNQFMNETLKIKEELFNLKDVEKTPQKRDEIMREIYNLQKMVNINDPKSFSYYYEIYQLKTNFLYKVFGKNN